jgi:hypothetical protein
MILKRMRTLPLSSSGSVSALAILYTMRKGRKTKFDTRLICCMQDGGKMTFPAG